MSDKPDYEMTMDLPEATKAALATSAKQDDMIAMLKQYEFIPSDVLKKSDDTEEYAMPADYTEIKTIDFDPTGVVKRAKLRIKFDMKSGYAGETAYGRIYRNGAAVGKERTNNTKTYATYSEDLDAWSVFDDIQLYVKYVGTHAPGTYVRNFRVYADIQEITYEPSW